MGVSIFVVVSCLAMVVYMKEQPFYHEGQEGTEEKNFMNVTLHGDLSFLVVPDRAWSLL